jgi:hypothetical protein
VSTIERYAVRISYPDGKVHYVSIGTGETASIQEAHLYARKSLALAKAAQENELQLGVSPVGSTQRWFQLRWNFQKALDSLVF